MGHRELCYALLVIAVASFFNYLDRMVLSMLLEPIKLELGFCDTHLGLLGGFQTGGTVGMAPGFIAAGWISDNYHWHMALYLLGVPEILIALLVRLTVKDPA